MKHAAIDLPTELADELTHFNDRDEASRIQQMLRVLNNWIIDHVDRYATPHLLNRIVPELESVPFAGRPTTEVTSEEVRTIIDDLAAAVNRGGPAVLGHSHSSGGRLPSSLWESPRFEPSHR
jgi:hypothetical protein